MIIIITTTTTTTTILIIIIIIIIIINIIISIIITIKVPRLLQPDPVDPHRAGLLKHDIYIYICIISTLD